MTIPDSPDTLESWPDPTAAAPAWWTAQTRARLVNLCWSITGDPLAGEDLAQETLLEAWRHRERLVSPDGADRWLNAIARNVCRRWARAQRRLGVPCENPEPGMDPGTDLESTLEREELVELLDRALGLLPAATRSALVAHYVEERSHADIARRSGSTAAAVSMRLTRGKARLRFLLETRFADDPLAEAWLRRDEAGWRRTRLRCVSCGRTTTSVRSSPEEIAFRCDTCDPRGLTIRLPLDTPVFGSLVGGLQRPSAVMRRLSAWALDYWTPMQAPDRVRCVRCGRLVAVQPYVRADAWSWSTRRGWYADCDGCGEQVSGSLAGLALALPEVQAARAREPRLRARPAREVERDGQPAMVLSFGPPDGSETVGAVFLRKSLRLVHVASASPALTG
ncbi:MAG TPA: RNA polymerase sigma factor [Nocardioidaceae bacterium]